MNPKKIVITGKIGSGKSSFINILKDKGQFELRSADDDAKEIISNNINEIQEITNRICGEGIDYREVFFKNQELKREIEDLVYNKLYNFYASIESDKDIFFEIPLYFESIAIANKCGFIPDEVIYINVAKDIRYRRLKTSRNMTDQDIIDRDKYFVSDEFARENAHIIIDNNESLQRFQERIIEYLDKKYKILN